MQAPRCLNCDAELADGARFCSGCGQRADTARLTMRDIVRDLMQTFVNVERGPLAFAWALLVRPGIVAREYVDGRRRRHYGPFATLMVLVGLSALAVNLSGFQVLAHDGLPSGPTGLSQRHFNLLLLVQLPLLAGVCALLFRGDRRALPEHMVLVAYVLGVRAVLVALSVVLAFLAATTAPSTLQFYAFWTAWYLYFGWAASQFYRGRRWSTWGRGALAAALGHAAIVAMLFFASAVFELLATRIGR